MKKLYRRRRPSKKKFVLITKTGKHHPIFKGLECAVLCKRTRHGLIPMTEYYDFDQAEAMCKSLNNR